MQHRFLFLLPPLMLAACTEDQAPTAPTKSGGMAESHSGGHKVVNSLTDPGDGTCTAARCSLREAINAPGSTEISFAPGLTGTITLASPTAGGGTLRINKTLSITGPSARILIRRRSTDPDFRIFRIGTAGTVTLSNLIIRGGKSSAPTPGFGGGIYNSGTLRLINSVVAGNSAGNGGGIFNVEARLTLTDSRVASNSGDGSGGGIHNAGTTAALTLNRSTVSGNFVGVHGGGIFNDGGTVRLTRSTVSGNLAQVRGGGIWNQGGGTTLTASTVSRNSAAFEGGGIDNLDGRLTLTNSTVSSNSTLECCDGGGIANGGRATLRNTTVARNSAPDDGGGIRTSGPLTLINSLVALNTADAGPDVLKPAGVTVTARFSLLGIGNGSGVSNGVNGNQVGSQRAPLDPKLGPLGDNGGPTRTHALLWQSPAIDAASTPNCPTTDQRGVLRPQGVACDIGSYERR
jgi:CSLREA domain-containing protein